jgi:hypothetical protein
VPTGRLWFAGDPRVIGICTPVGDGKKKLPFARSRFLYHEDTVEAAIEMRPDQPLTMTFDPAPYNGSHPEVRWLAGHPKKPKRRERPTADRQTWIRRRLQEQQLPITQGKPQRR